MSKLRKYLDRIRYIDNWLTPTPIFAIKCLIVTMCLSYIMSLYFPVYEFIDKEHRCNKVTGKVEYFYNSSCYKEWRE